jgi:hypothetical protein
MPLASEDFAGLKYIGAYFGKIFTRYPKFCLLVLKRYTREARYP